MPRKGGFIRTQLFYYVSYTLFVLIINNFSSILWGEDDVLNRLKPIKKSGKNRFQYFCLIHPLFFF